MTRKPKIKIVDDTKRADEIFKLYEKSSHLTIVKWSLSLSKRTLLKAGIDYRTNEVLKEGFKCNELKQREAISMRELRQASLDVHKLARQADSKIHETALRCAGHAIASAHVKEHGLVASDYAIKTLGLLSYQDLEIISLERQWQLDELIKITRKA